MGYGDGITPYLEKLMSEVKSSPLLKLFEPIEANCPEQTIDLDVRIRGYDCVRVLHLNLSDSLYTLHHMIQKAFDFDNDHLFEFYLGQGIFQKTYTMPEGQTSGEELSVYETKLRDMELGKGQVFSYLFDFGDRWWFDIKVLQIAEGKVEAPAIIKAEHEPPQQYPEYEEDYLEPIYEEYYSEIDEEITVASILDSLEDISKSTVHKDVTK